MTAPFYVPPEQLVKDRADFARKGVDRGRPIIVMALDVGVLLVGENASPSLRKIGEIYDRIAFAGVGRFNEFETLRVAGVRYADLKGYSYARADVTAKGLANAYSQTLGQIFTHEVKPYEVDILVAELGLTADSDSLFRIRFDGTLQDAGPTAVIGAEEEAIADGIASGFRNDMSLSEALVLATGAIATAMAREIGETAWEAGFLDRSAERRTFVRLAPEDVASRLEEGSTT
jgi:proteasome alpha subunit